MTMSEPRRANLSGGGTGSEAIAPDVPYQDLRVSGVRVEAYGTQSDRRPPLLQGEMCAEGAVVAIEPHLVRALLDRLIEGLALEEAGELGKDVDEFGR